MAFEMSGSQELSAPREVVWWFLNDAEVLRRCIPGCQSLEHDGENGFVATTKVKIGPIGATFKGRVRLEDLNPPVSYTLTGTGDGGLTGSAKGTARVELSEGSKPSTTLLAYTVDAAVAGKMAQLGARLINSVAAKLTSEFFGKFADEIDNRDTQQEH